MLPWCHIIDVPKVQFFGRHDKIMISKIPEWQEASTAVAFVARLWHDITKNDGLHRRADERVPIAVPVKIEILGECLNPVGAPIHGITRDMSNSGLGIYHAEKLPIDNEVVFVQVSVQELDGPNAVVVIGQVRHTKSVGHFEHTGIEFLLGLDDED